jgi:hypothetical protein
MKQNLEETKSRIFLHNYQNKNDSPWKTPKLSGNQGRQETNLVRKSMGSYHPTTPPTSCPIRYCSSSSPLPLLHVASWLSDFCMVFFCVRPFLLAHEQPPLLMLRRLCIDSAWRTDAGVWYVIRREKKDTIAQHLSLPGSGPRRSWPAHDDELYKIVV